MKSSLNRLHHTSSADNSLKQQRLSYYPVCSVDWEMHSDVQPAHIAACQLLRGARRLSYQAIFSQLMPETASSLQAMFIFLGLCHLTQPLSVDFASRSHGQLAQP